VPPCTPSLFLLEVSLLKFTTKLSKVDLQPEYGGISSRKKVYDFLTGLRQDELLPQYFELLTNNRHCNDMTQRLVKKCLDRKSLVASNAKVGLFRDHLEQFELDDIVILDDFWIIVQDYLGSVANTLDASACWMSSAAKRADPTPDSGNTSRGGGKGKSAVKLAAVKSKTGKPAGGKPKATVVAPGEVKQKWNCRTCGNQHNCRADGTDGTCPFAKHDHPDRNTTTKTWALSDAGKRWKAKSCDSMPLEGHTSNTIDGQDFDMDRKNISKKTGESITTHLNTISSIDYAHLPCQLSLNHRLGQEYLLPVPRALADTGSSEYSFISPRFLDSIKKSTVISTSRSNVHVSGALRGQSSIPCLGKVLIPLRIFNELIEAYEMINIEFHKLDIEEYDIIIGRIDIRDQDILKKCHDQIMWDTRPGLIEDKNVSTATLAAHYAWLGE
jgi:hypothetical protein